MHGKEKSEKRHLDAHQYRVPIGAHARLQGGLDGVRNVVFGLEGFVEEHAGQGCPDHVVDVGANLFLKEVVPEERKVRRKLRHNFGGNREGVGEERGKGRWRKGAGDGVDRRKLQLGRYAGMWA